MKNLFALYCHWPYCLSKCPYCDFYSLPIRPYNETLFLDRYKKEIALIPNTQKLSSIFFGGGTPSLMPIPFIEEILNAIYKHFHVSKNVEISIEANPDAIDLNKMISLKNLGFNRISLGIQSLNETALGFLGRRHSLKTARQRIKEAISCFHNVSIDLIYALPQQTWEMWEKELSDALEFNLPHYSLYQLTIEENTPFFNKKILIPDDITARTLFLNTIQKMDAAGVPLYEVSNFSKPGFECLHNQTYWRGKDYAGIGPAAHSRLGLVALENPRNIDAWLKGNKIQTTLSKKQKEEERILMGLRQKEGIEIKHISPTSISSAAQKGWIFQKGNRIYPTNEGLVMLNSLILELWP